MLRRKEGGKISEEEILKKIRKLEEELRELKGTPCEIFSRSVGYLRPTSQWNEGKQEEFKERKVFRTWEAKNGNKRKRNCGFGCG